MAARLRSGRLYRRPEFAWLAGAMAASLVGAALVLHLWNADPHVPFAVSGDANLYMMLVQDLLHSGWYLQSDLLGAPQGRELYDYAAFSGDVASMLLVKVLGVAVSDVALATNAYYLLTFPLAAAAAFLVLRRLGVSHPSSAACAVLFALAPYHFLRGEGHLFISGYFAVPVAAYLVLAVLLGHELVRRRPWRSTAATAACCLLVAWGSIYYAVFALVLIVLATLIVLVRREFAQVRQGLLVAALLSAVLVITLSPHIVHGLRHGSNPAVSERGPGQSERFALTPAQMVMPINGHRLKPLARLADRYISTTVSQGERTAQLGLLGTLALVAAFALVLAGALGARVAPALGDLPRAASVGAVLTVLVGTTGGISSMIAYLLTPQIRSWSRLSIFALFFVLILVALAFDALRERRPFRGRSRWAWPAAVAGVVVLAVLDATSAAYPPDYRATDREWSNDGRFVHAIEDRVGAHAMIFQLPYMGYPEVPPVQGMADYDPSRGYLHSETLRWSYGGMRGRPQEWADDAVAQSAARLLPSVVATGFTGLWIDRAGYADGGAGLEAVAGRLTGVRPLISENGRLAFYDLRDYASRLRGRYGAPALRALRDATLAPLALWQDGFYEAETDGVSAGRWMGARGTLVLDNRRSSAREVVMEARLEAPRPAQVEVRLPDGRVVRLRPGRRPAALRERMRLRPGRSRVEFTTDSPAVVAPPETRDLRLRLIDPLVVDTAARPVLDGP